MTSLTVGSNQFTLITTQLQSPTSPTATDLLSITCKAFYPGGLSLFCGDAAAVLLEVSKAKRKNGSAFTV